MLQSFPHRIGAARICNTAWHQAAGAAAAGTDLLVMPGSVHRPLPAGIEIRPTLSRGRVRIPYRALGRMRALKLHDQIVARSLPRLAERIDVVHAWPTGALQTLRTAHGLGITTVLERPNAHTGFAYEVVRDECRRLGVALPPGHEHAYDAAVLAREEEEFALADHLLCPADFVARTFIERGFEPAKLIRHQYGYDGSLFRPSDDLDPDAEGLQALFVGVCAVRKGVHLALEAWLASPASRTGRLRIAGEFLPDYRARLQPLLDHPSVEVLGHRSDVPELMRDSHLLVLPSLEEGSALVVGEALASGSVPVVSDASSAFALDCVNSLVHPAGDGPALMAHFTALHEDRALLRRLRAGALRTAADFSWARAGDRLSEIYAEVGAGRRPTVQAQAA